MQQLRRARASSTAASGVGASASCSGRGNASRNALSKGSSPPNSRWLPAISSSTASEDSTATREVKACARFTSTESAAGKRLIRQVIGFIGDGAKLHCRP